MLECEWIKAHTNPPNPYNDEADKLAKEGNDEDILNLTQSSWILLTMFLPGRVFLST